MVVSSDLNLQQDVITLRMSHLSKSADFRAKVIERLGNDEDPFNMKNFALGGVNVKIVGDDLDEFADKLDSVLGAGAGDDYRADEQELSQDSLRDTPENREHIWGYWKDQAELIPGLRPKKRLADESALSGGTAARFSGEYTGTGPDIELSEDDKGLPMIMFRNTPQIWGKLVGGGAA